MNSLKRPPKPIDYKHGDYHLPTGRMVNGYFYDTKWRLSLYKATNIFEMQIEGMFKAALQRAREKQLPFDIDIPYLKSIAKQTCPIFGIQLNWGINSDGKSKHNSASLDKVIPEWGYIKGNVAIISHIANKIKQDVTYQDLYKVADWLHDQEKETRKNVKPEQLTSLPKQSRRKIKDNTTHGTVHGARTGEDCDGAHHHLGGTEGDNPHRGAETSGGVGMGSGVSEVGTLETPQSGESDGHTKAEDRLIEQYIRRICYESGKLGMVVRAGEDIRLSDHRRELEVQRPVNEAIQGTEEAPKKLQAPSNPNWNTLSAELARLVESSWYTGLGPEAGDKPDKV